MSLNKILDKYSYFVSHRPFLMILIVIIFIFLAVYFATQVEMISQDTSEMIPDNYPVVEYFKILEDNFSSPESIMIALIMDRESPLKDPLDIKSPEIIIYTDKLTNYLKDQEFIESVNSAASVLREYNNGILPQSKSLINQIISENPQDFESYISKDNYMSLINISLSPDFDETNGVDDKQLIYNLNKNINNLEKPSSITVNIAGKIAEGPIINQELGPDMARTSIYSIYGIIIILILIFVVGEIKKVFKKKISFIGKVIEAIGALRFSVTPLITIAVGVIWSFGYIGLINLNITSVTSGVISMIMGIGIDFGIQIVTRFRQELKNNIPEKAMQITFRNVFMSMATTTLAALIGFNAMGMGELSFVGELGSIMSYGVTACFLVAITLIPSILVLFEKGMISLRKYKFMRG